MKSIKPGRGPSMMGGVMGIAAALFGVLWVVAVASFGGGFFALFGLIFIAVAIVQAVYNFKNATSKNRYSAYDITEHDEEPDPFNEHISTDTQVREEKREVAFCPYCGAQVEAEFAYCSRCGKKLPS